MNNTQKFAERLFELLIDNDIKPANLADRLGVNRKVISRYVKGKRLPSVDMAIRMSQHFECTIDFLLGRSDNNGKTEVVNAPLFKDRIVYLLQFFNKTKYVISKETHIDQSVIYDWQKGTVSPSMNSIIKLADYFDCSVEFVIGRTHNLY